MQAEDEKRAELEHLRKIEQIWRDKYLRRYVAKVIDPALEQNTQLVKFVVFMLLELRMWYTERELIGHLRDVSRKVTELENELKLLDVSQIQYSPPMQWDVLASALPKKCRELIYEPCRDDLLAEFLLARKKIDSTWRGWTRIRFTLRTLGMITGCYRVVFIDKLFAPVLKLRPFLRTFLGI